MMTPIANAIVKCNIQVARDLLNNKKSNFDWKTLNSIYNQDDTVLSLSIKHCPDLFRELTDFKVEMDDEDGFIEAINDSTFNQLTTDNGISHQSLLMMATRRSLYNIVFFLVELPLTKANVNFNFNLPQFSLIILIFLDNLLCFMLLNQVIWGLQV